MIYEQTKFAKLKTGKIVEIDSEFYSDLIDRDTEKHEDITIPNYFHFYHIVGTRGVVDKREIEKIADRKEDL